MLSWRRQPGPAGLVYFEFHWWDQAQSQRRRRREREKNSGRTDSGRPLRARRWALRAAALSQVPIVGYKLPAARPPDSLHERVPARPAAGAATRVALPFVRCGVE